MSCSRTLHGCCQWVSNPRALDSESDALPPPIHSPLNGSSMGMKTVEGQKKSV